jgi:3'-5' exoribonuclease
MPDAAPASVKELKSIEGAPGRPFASVLILRKVTSKTASNGNTYLSAEFGDRTGSFSCTIFSDGPAFEPVRTAKEGSVLRIEGKSDSYQGRFSPKLTKASVLSPEELGSTELISNLVEVPPEEPALLWRDFNAFAEAIPHPELRATVRAVVEDIVEAFRTAPAATSMHHAYRHGLLEHTVHMARACHAVLPLYSEVDPSLAMAGILLHDVGKTIEYEGGLSSRRTRKGILQGHVVLGYQLVRKAAIRAKLDADRMERLEHMILSHQGQLEWGAAALAATPEAVFVSMIDNLDAKMGMVQRALRNAPEGDEFTERLPGLEAPLLARPLPAD